MKKFIYPCIALLFITFVWIGFVTNASKEPYQPMKINIVNEEPVPDKEGPPTLEEVAEMEKEYPIFSSDLISGFLEGKELAKTGNPTIDGFLERFYQKVLNGDDYIQFFLENAKYYGVDTDIIQDLIDMNAKRKVGVWLGDIKEILSEKESIK